ncbi:hypothetical protein [Specibacter sp. RAF43]|uniref:hypothetical protein n=1 Tax=Specibacter sp. RAF43 TaxID=3233057 RepID=UPI003F9B03A6
MPARKNRHRPAPEAPPEAPAAPSPIRHLSGSTLAEYLVSAERTRAAVVVSYKPDAGSRRIDAAYLAGLLGEEADVFEIVSGPETRRLEDGLPPGLHIFGTGARAYPAGPHWQLVAPGPRVAGETTNLARLAEQVVGDLHAAGRRAPPPAAPSPRPLTATAVVSGFASDSRALVTLAGSGRQVSVRAEDLLPGVPLNWVLSQGQRVNGLLDADNATLDIHGMLPKPASPVSVYRSGDVALARVSSVSAGSAHVVLWPGAEFRIGVERISSNHLDSAEDLLTEGEVVRVRVLYENGAVLFSMLDVDDDEPCVPAPVLVPGGPPWLALDRPYASIFAPPPRPAGESGAPLAASEWQRPGVVPAGEDPTRTAAERKTALQSTQHQLERARHVIDDLMAAARHQGATDKVARTLQDQLKAERDMSAEFARRHNEAMRQVEAFKAELAAIKAKLVETRRQLRSTSSRSETEPLFIDPADQFRFDVQLTWAQSVPAIDKAAEPLGDYAIGPDFLASLAVFPAHRRAKTLRAVVDLVAGRDGPLRNREPHPLRLNEGAHALVQMRGEDVCWRLYVEQKSSAALRLHYWKLPDGGIELSRVVTHDDVKP